MWPYHAGYLWSLVDGAFLRVQCQDFAKRTHITSRNRTSRIHPAPTESEQLPPTLQSISCAAMDDKASAKEILDDLTRLSQAGRLRHMKTLDQDDLIAVLGLSLQASDDSSNALKRGREASAARAEKKVKTKSK
jgi:hypothetical protein